MSKHPPKILLRMAVKCSSKTSQAAVFLALLEGDSHFLTPVMDSQFIHLD